MFLPPLVGLCLVTTSMLADERNPNVLERIGNFFYKVANKLERSDGPDDPGRSSSLRNRSRPPVRGTKSDGKVVPDASRNTSIAPVNPDPRLLRPREPVSENSSAVTAVGRASGNTHHPAPPPVKPTAPLPEPAKSGKAHDPAGSSANGAASRPGKGSDVPAAAKPGESAYPVAIPTHRLGRVKSPYPPHRELDVTGLPPGSLAKDPVTGKIFRLP